LIIIPSAAFAQTDISRVSVELGAVRNYQSSFIMDKLYSFSPGIKLGGRFIENYLEWDFSISYWDDGVNDLLPISDGFTFSYSSTILSAALNYYPEKVAIPIHFISGLSTRFVNRKYIGGEDMGGNIGKSSSFILYTLDFGAGLNFTITKTIRIRGDVLLFMPFNKKDFLFEKGWGGSAKLGMDYFLK